MEKSRARDAWLQVGKCWRLVKSAGRQGTATTCGDGLDLQPLQAGGGTLPLNAPAPPPPLPPLVPLAAAQRSWQCAP